MGKMTVRIAVALLALSAAGLIAGSRGAAADEPGDEGLTFAVRCTRTGDLQDAGLGSVSCMLKVSGLPAPLSDSVNVTFATPRLDTIADSPSDTDVGETLVSSEAPDIEPGAPFLVTRRLPAPPPPRPPTSPQVPDQPPRSL